MSKFDLGGTPDRGRGRIEEIAASINAKYGTHTALPLEVAAMADVIRLPTGVFEIDWKTRGGFPWGRAVRLYGPKSTLKTTLCLRLTSQAQGCCRHCKAPIVTNPETGVKDCRCPKPRFTMADAEQFSLLEHNPSIQIMYGVLPDGVQIPKKGDPFLIVKDGKKKEKIVFTETYRNEPCRCIFIESEHTIDKRWARKNRVDTRLVQLVNGKWAEQVLDTAEDLILTQEFDLIIIDSLTMLTPEDELRKSHRENPKIADQAGLVTRACKKWTSAMAEGGLMNRYAPMIVGTEQVRTKGLGYGQRAFVGAAGGKAIEHVVSLEIQMKAKGYEFEGDVAKYGNFEFKVTKTKIGGSPHVEGAFRFWLKPTGNRPVGDTEDKKIVVKHARELGLIDDSKGYMLASDFVEGGVVECRTLKVLDDFLVEHPSVYADLRARVLTTLIQKDENEDVEIVTAPEEEPEEEPEPKPVKKKGGRKKGIKKSGANPLDMKFKF